MSFRRPLVPAQRDLNAMSQTVFKRIWIARNRSFHNFTRQVLICTKELTFFHLPGPKAGLSSSVLRCCLSPWRSLQVGSCGFADHAVVPVTLIWPLSVVKSSMGWAVHPTWRTLELGTKE